MTPNGTTRQRRTREREEEVMMNGGLPQKKVRRDLQTGKWSEVSRSMVRPPGGEKTKQRKQVNEWAGWMGRRGATLGEGVAAQRRGKRWRMSTASSRILTFSASLRAPGGD